MKRILLVGMAVTCLAFAAIAALDVDMGKGKSGGGAKGGGAIRGGSGGGVSAGGARPNPGISHSPTISPGNTARPNNKASAPKMQAPQQKMQGNLNMPSNFQKPAQLPQNNRPPVQMAGGGAGGNFKAPGGGGNKLPDFMGNQPANKGNLADLQKKNPGGVFDNKQLPNNRLPGTGNLPNHPASKNDIANWMGQGNISGKTQFPGKGGIDNGIFGKGGFDDKGIIGKGGIDKGIIGKGGIDQGIIGKGGINQKGINNDFTNNWKNAANIGNKANIGNQIGGGNINIGNMNVDLSRNNNFQQLNNHRNVVNNNLRPYQNNWFNNNWWNSHPGVNRPWWNYHNFYPNPGMWWRPCTWGSVVNWSPSTAWAQPVYYDYGSNVVIQNDVVYLNDEPVSSAPVYAQQAIQLADVEPPPQNTKMEWLPLGTWALSSKKEDDNPSTILQLALSKDGLVSGSWFNRTTDQSADVEGKVDPDTQRVAIRKADQPDVVLEVGVYNLSQTATPCLMHFGTLNTQTWYLIRLEGDDTGK